MASELRVDTLKDASGNNSVATSTVASGSAKAWCLFEGDGTAAITDSFNFGSITDNGTGDYSFAITNNMSNGNYCVPCGTVKDTGGQTTNIAVDHDNPPSASVLRMLCVDDYTQAQRDGELQSFNVLGDLA
tara:strand:- start:19525 stop:19917 length:393 start_codon:yes stop_codon:yes gene_type:complete